MQRILVDGQQRELPRLTERKLPLRFIKDMSLAVVGARRCGKTYRTHQLVAELMRKKVARQDICRVQFNDLRLARLTAQDLLTIDEAYYALYPEKRGRRRVWFIFDEIHRVDGWEDYILYLLEEGLHRVLITGSTSRLLSGRIASALRGKNFSVELFPFSFREFIQHYGVAPDTLSSRGRSHLRKMFDRYLHQGGFPGLLDLDPALHVDLLQNYWETMLLRDVVEAHPDENIRFSTLFYFAQALASRISCPMTVRGIGAGMMEAGLQVSGETLYRYLHHLEEAFMLVAVPFYSKSEKVRNRHYRKVYAIDWALADSVTPGEGINLSRRFENLVYVELRRRGHDIYYYRTRKGYEIDFVAVPRKRRAAGRRLFQVCYRFGDPEVRRRELRGIAETLGFLEIAEATVLTANEEESLTVDGHRVSVVPAWRWLLADESCHF